MSVEAFSGPEAPSPSIMFSLKPRYLHPPAIPFSYLIYRFPNRTPARFLQNGLKSLRHKGWNILIHIHMMAWTKCQAKATNVLRDELFLELDVSDGDYDAVIDQVTHSYPQATSFMNNWTS